MSQLIIYCTTEEQKTLEVCLNEMIPRRILKFTFQPDVIGFCYCVNLRNEDCINGAFEIGIAIERFILSKRKNEKI